MPSRPGDDTGPIFSRFVVQRERRAGRFLPIWCEPECSDISWGISEISNGSSMQGADVFLGPVLKSIFGARLCPQDWSQRGGLEKPLDNRKCCGWSSTQPRSVGKTRFANRLRGGLVHDNTIPRIIPFACARSERRRAAALQDASRPASHNLSRQRLGVRPALWRFCSKPEQFSSTTDGSVQNPKAEIRRPREIQMRQSGTSPALSRNGSEDF